MLMKWSAMSKLVIVPKFPFRYFLQTLKCHNKQTSDFAFVGSSSFIATAGHSSDGR